MFIFPAIVTVAPGVLEYSVATVSNAVIVCKIPFVRNDPVVSNSDPLSLLLFAVVSMGMVVVGCDVVADDKVVSWEIAVSGLIVDLRSCVIVVVVVVDVLSKSELRIVLEGVVSVSTIGDKPLVFVVKVSEVASNVVESCSGISIVDTFFLSVVNSSVLLVVRDFVVGSVPSTVLVGVVAISLVILKVVPVSVVSSVSDIECGVGFAVTDDSTWSTVVSGELIFAGAFVISNLAVDSSSLVVLDVCFMNDCSLVFTAADIPPVVSTVNSLPEVPMVDRVSSGVVSLLVLSVVTEDSGEMLLDVTPASLTEVL